MSIKPLKIVGKHPDCTGRALTQNNPGAIVTLTTQMQKILVLGVAKKLG
jgi:hypothetical protein